MAKQVNVYKCDGEWCYALIVDGEHDHSDTLDVLDGASEAEAMGEAARQWQGAAVRRAADVTARKKRDDSGRAMTTYTIANVAGGDLREYTWTGEISDDAIRHANSIGFGGPVFGGEASEAASAAYERVCEDRAQLRD